MLNDCRPDFVGAVLYKYMLNSIQEIFPLALRHFKSLSVFHNYITTLILLKFFNRSR